MKPGPRWFRRIAVAASLSGVAPACSSGDYVIGAPKKTGGIIVPPGSGAGGASGLCSQCSADLHDVTDCNGNVLKTCPDTEGCSAGACVEACEAAKANGSTQGCEFYSVVPAALASIGTCFAALLANTWTTSIDIQADFGGLPLDAAVMARTPSGSGPNLTYESLPNGKLPPGQMAILFLANHRPLTIVMNPLECPPGIQPGIVEDPGLFESGIGNAFHITTSAPVAAYDMYPYGGAPAAFASATLLVPTSAWGTNYMAADAYRAVPPPDPPGPFIQIVAAENDTQVTIRPTAAIVGGPNVAATGAGQPHTYALSKGQVLQFLQTDELTGSPISSDMNKPIGVWGGSSFMQIPSDACCGDSAHQELLPIKALGFEYVAVRYRDRAPSIVESIPWTLVGVVDHTVLTYDPSRPLDAPETIDSGQWFELSTSQVFSVRSSDDKHPFYLAAHMTGADTITNAPDESDVGDPEFVNTVPPQQWLSSYVFLTDPTYKNTNLVFVRQKAKDMSFKDVSLDCAGRLTGWAPVGVNGQYEFTRFDLVTHGLPHGACDNGPHVAKSAAAFGLTVWGWDNSVSYAYPAGMGIRPINTVVVPPIPK